MKCYWCGGVVEGSGHQDHIVSKHLVRAHGRTVLSCARCNKIRGQKVLCGTCCICGKYRGGKYNGIVCDKCNVPVRRWYAVERERRRLSENPVVVCPCDSEYSVQFERDLMNGMAPNFALAKKLTGVIRESCCYKTHHKVVQDYTMLHHGLQFNWAYAIMRHPATRGRVKR
jgi:hypothetical protein